ncbi:hypothetical protein DICVIV_09373 [Dictyocaulus viviparus]|uniref:Uncharacterized protein n=1 Tax=Dictyocaulus viviparus TaxID=29172 RepID=A0A0D8XQD7_DICVI|nr:hypothetical protein DICVIV_09373 [Dictyocaulus viviparus]
MEWTLSRDAYAFDFVGIVGIIEAVWILAFGFDQLLMKELNEFSKNCVNLNEMKCLVGLGDAFNRQISCKDRCIRIYQRTLARVGFDDAKLRELLEKQRPLGTIKDICWFKIFTWSHREQKTEMNNERF